MENLIAHALLAVFALVGPRVRLKTEGGNAAHSMFGGVAIRRPDHPTMKGQFWPGVLAQDTIELRLLWLVPVIVTAAPVALIDGHIAVMNAAGFFACVIGHAVLRRTTNGLDYLGTNIEIFMGEKVDPDYRAKELARKADPVEFDRGLKRWERAARLVRFMAYRPFFVAREVR